MGQWSCLEFRFICVLGSQQTPQDGLQGVDWIKWRQPCKSWLYPIYWGSTRELGTVWIVLSGSRCGILGFALASIVTLERCRRSCGGALSRNLHRGSINLWCPADSDRPTDGWAVSLAIFQEWLFSCSRVNICQTLPPSLWEGGCPQATHCG